MFTSINLLLHPISIVTRSPDSHIILLLFVGNLQALSKFDVAWVPDCTEYFFYSDLGDNFLGGDTGECPLVLCTNLF